MQLLTKIKKIIKHGAWYPFYNTFYEWVPINPRMILLESRSGKALESNILSVLKELKKKPYRSFRIILPVQNKEVEEAIKKKIQYHGLRVDKIVRYGSVAYYYYLSRAGYLVNDTTFPGRFIKKDKQIYLNTWHGTPLKKMGRNNKSEAAVMGNVLRNLLCADYLVFPNEYMEEKMSDAYMLRELYKGTILHEGYPRNDIFQRPEDGMRLKKEQGFGQKRLIAYLPTFRGIFNRVDETDYIEVLKKSLEIWEKTLEEEEILLLKLHPFIQTNIDMGEYSHIQMFPKNWDTNEGLNACDVLVTDYSSVMYDYANCRRKIIIYAYDMEQYLNSRGIYEPLTRYPFQIARTAQEVMEMLHQPGGDPSDEFLKKYATWEDGKAAARICRQVFLGENCCRIERLKGDGRENILIYGGDLAQNGITTALCAMLEGLDLHKYHYFVSFRTDYVKDYPERLERLPDNVGIYPLASEMNTDFLTAIVHLIWFYTGKRNHWMENRIKKAYQREWKKHYNNCEFRCAVHYNGYERYIILLMNQASCPKVIWVHNHMEQEIKTKHNQNRYLLEKAYGSYEQVIAVSEDILDSIYDISGKKDNVQVISNLIDYKKIIKQSEQPIAFDRDTVSNVSLEKLNKILDGDGEKFINIGRFSPEKGHSRLIDAFDRYWAEHQESYLIIIGGDGPLYRDILKYAGTKKSSKNILLLKKVSNPMPILRKCSLFLMSSYYEGLGLVILEADVLGIPVASCDVPGPRGFLKKNGGTLVENSTEGLIEAMKQYHCGNICAMDVDYAKMNRDSLQKCERLLEQF